MRERLLKSNSSTLNEALAEARDLNVSHRSSAGCIDGSQYIIAANKLSSNNEFDIDGDTPTNLSSAVHTQNKSRNCFFAEKSSCKR